MYDVSTKLSGETNEHALTPRSSALIQKLIVAQLINKLPTCKWTCKFIIVSTRHISGLCSEPLAFRPHSISCFFKICFHIFHHPHHGLPYVSFPFYLRLKLFTNLSSLSLLSETYLCYSIFHDFVKL
jgi:hypothetical protein